MIDIPDKDRLTQHEGHRQRLKKRFVKDGFEYFEPHNILEMALFYTSPRQDTNGLAHDLIRRFGSLSGVLDAPFDVLCSVPGVGDETAIFLKMIPELARMYSQSRQAEKTVLTEPDDAVAFFAPRFLGRTNEVFMAAFLNGRGEVIATDVFSEGDGSAVVMDVMAVSRRLRAGGLRRNRGPQPSPRVRGALRAGRGHDRPAGRLAERPWREPVRPHYFQP